MRSGGRTGTRTRSCAPRSLASSSSPSRVMSMPSMTMRPVVGASSPAIRPSSVDLPLPDGPTMASVSPSGSEVEGMEDGQRLPAARHCLGNAVQFNHEVGVSGSRGRSFVQTSSAMRCAPTALGWMPSGWFIAGTPATPSSRNGKSVTCLSRATSVDTARNSRVYSAPRFGGASIPQSRTRMPRLDAASTMRSGSRGSARGPARSSRRCRRAPRRARARHPRAPSRAGAGRRRSCRRTRPCSPPRSRSRPRPASLAARPETRHPGSAARSPRSGCRPVPTMRGRDAAGVPCRGLDGTSLRSAGDDAVVVAAGNPAAGGAPVDEPLQAATWAAIRSAAATTHRPGRTPAPSRPRPAALRALSMCLVPASRRITWVEHV